MHAMSSRHNQHHFHQDQQSPSPPPSSPYQPYAPGTDFLSPSATQLHQQSKSSSPYAPYLVTHFGFHPSTRPRSPIVSTPVAHAMSRSSTPGPPPSSSGHEHAREVMSAPSETPLPPEDVVMTSTINFARDVRDRPIINQYLIGHRLGNGQHGEVYKGYDMRRGNMVVAIKVCRRKNSKEAKHEQLRQRNQGPIPRSGGGFGGLVRPRLVDQLQNTEKKVLREIAIMKKCKHGQIVQLYEVINDRLTNKILLIMEYMGGGEVKWRDDHGRPCLRVDQTRRICRDVVLGLLYLHYQGIIHRDIKPANLLWTADRKNVKITDFGVSHFSAAQRIDALKQSPAYREALERRKQARRKREEDPSGVSTPGRRRTNVWRGKGSVHGSKEDVKGKGRARDEPPTSSGVHKSEMSSPVSDDEDAAAEKELLEELAGDVDPILLDDGGLSRQAGTPSFLAPEIIWEFGEKQTAALYSRVGLSRGKLKCEEDGREENQRVNKESRQSGERRVTGSDGRDGADMDKAPASLTATLKVPRRLSHTDDEGATPRASDATSQTSLDSELAFADPDQTQSTVPDPDPSSFRDPNRDEAGAEQELDLPPRPPITKVIDVWALGVTLYCLLFGRIPWGGVTEFVMYQMIHTDDFKVDDCMGYDRIPTGGRIHVPSDTSEGAIVIGLLDRLLEKDCTKRITLEEVKRLPWITRDIPNPEEWVTETAPERLDPIRITSADEDVAMSTVKFRWKFDMTKAYRRFRSLLPAGRTAAVRQQQQMQRRADQRAVYDAELDAILRRSLHIESESEISETPSERRIGGGSEATGLRHKPSRSRRVVDVVERGVKKISRHGSGMHTANNSGGETPRNLKRRTLPDLMLGSRGRSMSRSREALRSRLSSRASGPATPRVASGGSYSNLTSPSTAGFTSDSETDILDEDEVRAIHDSRWKEQKEIEKQQRQKATVRQSLSNISKIWRTKDSPRESLSESSSKGSLGMWKGLARSPASPASPARGNASGSGTGSDPASARASFATQRLQRRSADEFGDARTGMAIHKGVRAAGVRSDLGPVIASAGVATAGRGLALASADELTSAMRASSWGDVAEEFAYGYGYGASRRADLEFDADGVSDYGYGSGSAYGEHMYANGGGFTYESGDVDSYANEDDEVRLVGAGGILSHPVSGPSSPNSLSGVSVGVGGIPHDGFSLQGIAHEVGSSTSSPGSASSQAVAPGPNVNAQALHAHLQDSGRRRGTSVGSMYPQNYPHVVSSPLARSPINSEHEDAPIYDDFELDDGGNIHLSRNPSAEGSMNVNVERTSPESGERIVGRGMIGLRVEEEVQDNNVFVDDDSSSSEDAPIEVRRRRPSEILARSHSRARSEQPVSSPIA
ncbi:hypothetical protein ACEPAI_7278 [Sanghuangporus weigelae]